MKKKLLALLIIASMSMAMLMGCGSGGDSGSSSGAGTSSEPEASQPSETAGGTAEVETGQEDQEDVTLTMWVWDDAQVPATQAMVDEFHEMYPYINVEITSIAGVDDYNTKMQTVIGTQDAPSVFWMNFNLAQEYISMGFVQDLTDYIDNDPDFDITGLNAGITDAYTVDGKIYGIAKDTDGFAVFYNKALFDAAGVAYPENDWTVDEFVQTAADLTGDGVVGWSNSTSDRVYYNFMYSYGGSPYTEDGSAANVNSEGSVEAMQVLLDMMNNGYAYNRAEMDELSSSVAFESNLAAMTIDGSWMVSEYSTALGENLGIVEVPSGPNGKASTGHGIAYATTTSNPHMEETWLFLSYLGSDAAQEKQVEVVIPAANACASTWEAVYPDLNLTAFVNALEYNKPYLGNKNATAARSAFQEYMANMQSGMYADAQEAMDAAEEAMNAAMDQ
ncbi:MAG TPA: sugar ABC transporter substrate-binding protein [Candidatus Eisenbergiella stercoravium]|nr:sugar ABC transporter substrate-binding protein [Candidatus Eisenbergiella stercoravium]